MARAASASAGGASAVSPTPPPKRPEPWDVWTALGSPRFVAAPMVYCSERAFRVAARARGVGLAYTPMIHAGLLLRSHADPKSVAAESYSHWRNVVSDVVGASGRCSGSDGTGSGGCDDTDAAAAAASEPLPGCGAAAGAAAVSAALTCDDDEKAASGAASAAANDGDGGGGGGVGPAAAPIATPPDRPLLLQLCSADPDEFAAAAALVDHKLSDHIDGIDLNLGCPQRSAERGGFGVSLANRHPNRAVAMIASASRATRLPVSAKIRVRGAGTEADKAGTVAFVRALADAGAWMVAVHGRTATQRHHHGHVRTDVIAAVVRAVPGVPVVANGGVRSLADAEAVLAETGCAAVMAAGGLLSNLGLFDKRGCGGETPTAAAAATPATTTRLDGRPRAPSHVDPVEQCELYLRYARAFPPPHARFVRDHLLEHFGQPLRFTHPDLYSMLARNQRVRTVRQFEELVRVLRHRLGGGATGQDLGSGGGDGIGAGGDGNSTPVDVGESECDRPLLTLRQIKHLADDAEFRNDGKMAL